MLPVLALLVSFGGHSSLGVLFAQPRSDYLIAW
jgi:hypothetical protein